MKANQKTYFLFSRKKQQNKFFFVTSLLITSLLLSLILYFKVSFFAFIFTFFVLFTSTALLVYKRQNERDEGVYFLSSGFLFKSFKTEIFIPWASVSHSSPFEFDENCSELCINLNGHIPGLDFIVYRYDFDVHGKETEGADCEFHNNSFTFKLPLEFSKFWEAHYAYALNLLLNSSNKRAVKAGSIDLALSPPKGNSCIIDPSLPVSFPAFCPFSGLEVDANETLRSENRGQSLEFRVSREGLDRQKKERQAITVACLILPLVLNLVGVVFFTFFDSVLSSTFLPSYAPAYIATYLFAALGLFFLYKDKRVVMKEVEQGKILLSFKDKEYFQAFLNLNLQEKESQHPFLDV